MLSIKDLHATVDGKEILRGINLEIKAGETHAIMGPNGSGKSTLSAVLAGNPAYTVTQGSVTFNGKDLLALKPHERANEGIFLSFQYPVEIPGVSMANFLKLMKEKKQLVEIDSKLTNRAVNEGFSGGEKKKNEIFQMAMLDPCLRILDETDSGLDIDALRIVAQGVTKLKNENNATVVITHYQRLLDYIVPDYIHILYHGRIVMTADKSLALELEEKGYDWIKEQFPD